MANLETILSWFQTGDKPTEEEFKQTFSSFRHNDRKVPITEVDGLESSLNNKLNVDDLPANMALVDEGETSDVFNKEQIIAMAMMLSDYVKDGKIRADKVEAFMVQLQSDWNQTDSSVADFIKNKPNLSLKADLVAGKVPASQLPSYVDDVLEFTDLATFPITGENGVLYLALDSNKLYRWSGSVYIDITQNESDTLQSVVARGNQIAPGGYISYSTSSTSRSLALGANSTTFSLFFGNMNSTHTGTFNIAMGFNSGANLSTGLSNILLGAYTGTNLTTGNFNTFVGVQAGRNLTTSNANTLIGSESGFSTTTGFKNTFLGVGAAYQNITGNLNTVVGYKAGLGNNLGDRNTIIGMGAGQGVSGTNNVLIGVGAGVSGGALTNKLIIHSNHTLSGYSNTAEGTMTTPQLSYLSNALITGDFAEKWVKFNGSFSINPGNIPVGDSTFNKVFVGNAVGQFGWINKIDYIPLSGTTTEKPVSGNIFFAEYGGLRRENQQEKKSGFIGFENGNATLSTEETINGYISKISAVRNGLEIISNDPTSRGLVANDDFTGNIQDLDFVQKKYVDSKVDLVNSNDTQSSGSYTLRKSDAKDGDLSYMKIKGAFDIPANNFISLEFPKNVDIGIQKVTGKYVDEFNAVQYVDFVVETNSDSETRIINNSEVSYREVIINATLVGVAKNYAK